MNMEYEIIDQSMTEFSIYFGIDLDNRFNITRKYRTVSQRDVPGTIKQMSHVMRKPVFGVSDQVSTRLYNHRRWIEA